MSFAMWPAVAGGRFHLDARLAGFQSPGQLKGERELAIAGANAAVCFDVTNVAQFFYEVSEQDYWDWLVDFPCVAPPFDVFWMEFRAPRMIRTDAGTGPWVSAYDGLGAIFQASRPSQMASDPDMLSFLAQQTGLSANEIRDLLARGAQATDDAWVLRIDGFMRQAGRIVMMPERFILQLDATGRPSLAPWLFPLYLPDDNDRDWITKGLTGIYFPFGLALSFLHCKNVAITDAPDPRQRQARRDDERTGLPTPHYKSLVIEPMKRVLSSEGRMGEVGLKKALHICRGHFAHYSDDKPLFGKYSGQFWRPAHVRGTTEAGEVVKDYVVRAPKGRAA